MCGAEARCCAAPRGAVLLATAVLFTTDIPTQLAAGAPSYVSSLQHLERSHAAAATCGI